MSVVRYEHLSCDECLTWIDEHTAAEARAHARREGWPHVALANDSGRPLDFCTDACKVAYFAAKSDERRAQQEATSDATTSESRSKLHAEPNTGART